MAMPHTLDTSPIITDYNMELNNRGGLISSNNRSVTGYYALSSYVGSITQAITGGGQLRICAAYKDYDFVDYWTNRIVFNAGTNQIRATIDNVDIDNIYAYMPLNSTVDQGKILFAGKNTIYYGHRNISELS